MKSAYITKLTKYLLDFMFYSGILVCLALPLIFKFIGRWYETFRTHYISMCILFFLSGTLAVLILGELRRMLGTVLKKTALFPEM